VSDTPADLEAGMTYVEKLDFREQAHRHDLERLKLTEVEATKRARYRRSEERQETMRWVGLFVCVAAAVLGIAFFIWQGTSGPESKVPGKDERREQACVVNGGGWVPDDMLASSSDGLCVFPGETSGQ